MAEQRGTPGDEVRRLYEEAEQRTAEAMEELVRRDSFGELLARVTENVMALTRIGFDVVDLGIRNLRLAGRQDLVKLGRQLARTEDKLEMVLQAVERLEDEVRSQQDGGGRSGGGSRANGARARGRAGGRSRSGQGAASDAGEGSSEGGRSGRSRSS